MRIKRQREAERPADVKPGHRESDAPEGETLTPEHWDPLRAELGAILGIDPDKLRPRD